MQPSALTRREQEVANLLGRRFTSRQIASQLNLSEHTINKHVTNILRKLNLHSREQVGAKMAEQRSHLAIWSHCLDARARRYLT